MMSITELHCCCVVMCSTRGHPLPFP